MLEVRHGLDINNINHIWLLHYLFLNTINVQLDFFAQSWNHHVIQIRNGPNRSPADLFGFDMFTQGVRGTQLPTPNDTTSMSNEELEVFGVDWEGLRSDILLESREANNPSTEGTGTWLGRNGPPEHLNEVPVEPPSGIFSVEELTWIDGALAHTGMAGSVDDADIVGLWVQAIALAQNIYPDMF
jgi:hypothetical protein